MLISTYDQHIWSCLMPTLLLSIHLQMFSDSTATRFVTVELASCDCPHAETFTHHWERANQMFCLAR